MKIIGNTISRTFIIKFNHKKYYVNYLNSDYSNSELLNRNNWEITEEDGEELNIYEFGNMSKRESIEVDRNRKKFEQLVSFCIKNFNFYKPKV